jgi:surfeit locus 1 family protein
MAMRGDETAARSTASLAVLLALALLAFAGFMTLGVWQVRRLAWKEDLIARVDARIHANAQAAPGRRQWSSITREADEYRRVFVQGRFDFAHEALVHASTALGSGYWVITPLRTDAGDWLLVNRGFIPPELRDNVPHGDANVSTVGLLRMTEPKGSFLQHNDPSQGRWYSRDVAAIAANDHLASAAPYFIDQQSATRADEQAWPRPGLTVVQFPNNHLVYALTWFALAAGVAAAAAYVLAHERYLRRSEPGPVPSRAY